MTLREAEKTVLEAADRWDELDSPEVCEALTRAVRAWRALKSAGKPKAKCYCGKIVSIEGDHLRHHKRADNDEYGHAPSVSHVLEKGGTLL